MPPRSTNMADSLAMCPRYEGADALVATFGQMNCVSPVFWLEVLNAADEACEVLGGQEPADRVFASSRHRCRPSAVGSHHPLPVSTALWAWLRRATSANWPN